MPQNNLVRETELFTYLNIFTALLHDLYLGSTAPPSINILFHIFAHTLQKSEFLASIKERLYIPSYPPSISTCELFTLIQSLVPECVFQSILFFVSLIVFHQHFVNFTSFIPPGVYGSLSLHNCNIVVLI